MQKVPASAFYNLQHKLSLFDKKKFFQRKFLMLDKLFAEPCKLILQINYKSQYL